MEKFLLHFDRDMLDSLMLMKLFSYTPITSFIIPRSQSAGVELMSSALLKTNKESESRMAEYWGPDRTTCIVFGGSGGDVLRFHILMYLIIYNEMWFFPLTM